MLTDSQRRDLVPHRVQPEPGLAGVAAGLVHHPPLATQQMLLLGQAGEVVSSPRNSTWADCRPRPVPVSAPALLLLGFAGRLRRSELVGLDCEDLEEVESGLQVPIRSRPVGRLGRRICIAFGPEPETCPVTAVRAWRKVAKIATASLFQPVNVTAGCSPGDWVRSRWHWWSSGRFITLAVRPNSTLPIRFGPAARSLRRHWTAHPR
jgi:integrase